MPSRKTSRRPRPLSPRSGKEVEEAALLYRRHRQAGDRFGHLVDDVAETERRHKEQTEEFAIEDDLGDRRASGQCGF